MFKKLLTRFSKNKNELDEPLFMNVLKGDEAFQIAISDAQSNLEYFKKKLEELPEDVYACVKFFIPESQEASDGANIWLSRPFFENGSCLAQPFELPEEFSWIEVGQWLKFPEEDLLDWYFLSDSGDMLGGYSLSCQREMVAPEKRDEFDKRIGVKNYLEVSS